MTTPVAPSNLIIDNYSTGDGKIKTLLTWTTGSSGSGVFAKLEYCTGAACSGFTEFDTAPADWYSIHWISSQYIDGVLRTLTPGTIYRYRIRNEHDGDYSTYSNIAEITTLGAPSAPPSGTDLSVPVPPTNLTASPSGNTINLSWSDNAANETGYLIERRQTVGVSDALQWYNIAVVAADTDTYVDIGLQYQTQYVYRVRAYNLNGNSVYSNDATATTGSTTPSGLSAPTLTSATLENFDTDPQIKLVWTDNATTETNYYIERSSSDSAAGYTIIFVTGADVGTYTDPTVFYGVTYKYRVRAFRDSDGLYSPYSSVQTVTVAANGDGGGTNLTGINYGIRQFYGPTGGASNGAVVRDNDMENNGLGNLEPDLLTAPNVTIDNPSSDNLFIRRGVTIYQ